MTWQPIESAPKDGTRMLLTFGLDDYRPCVGAFRPEIIHDDGYNETGWVETYDEAPLAEPTHWMPLPDPPQ
jgi:hypothetical protein